MLKSDNRTKYQTLSFVLITMKLVLYQYRNLIKLVLN